MKQKELAAKLGVSESWVSAWVSGRTRIPAIWAIELSEMSGRCGKKKTGIGKILDMPGPELKRLIECIPPE